MCRFTALKKTLPMFIVPSASDETSARCWLSEKLTLRGKRRIHPSHLMCKMEWGQTVRLARADHLPTSISVRSAPSRPLSLRKWARGLIRQTRSPLRRTQIRQMETRVVRVLMVTRPQMGMGRRAKLHRMTALPHRLVAARPAEALAPPDLEATVAIRGKSA